MKLRKKLVRVLLCMACVGMLAACGKTGPKEEDASAAPDPTATPEPTATPKPTATPVPVNREITYDFNDLYYYQSYGTDYEIDKDGVITLRYTGEYQEIKLGFPEPIDMSKCLGVTVKMKSEVGQLAVKLYDENFNEIYVRYDGLPAW